MSMGGVVCVSPGASSDGVDDGRMDVVKGPSWRLSERGLLAYVKPVEKLVQLVCPL